MYILFENPMAARFRNRNNNILKIHNENCLDNNNTADCNCTKIQKVNSMKYLGVFFQKDLKWRTHTQYVKNKLNSIAFQMHFSKDILSIPVKVMIYKTLCESILRYAIETYGYTSEENIKPIKTTQKRIIKSTIYPFTSKRDRKEKMTEYQILSFPNLYKFIVITKHYTRLF
uniref:Uncharacterized protein n=1 Tax=Cacopsylla melanoneura TaxID=428564 RepID=A0A8D8T801_9HEMI